MWCSRALLKLNWHRHAASIEMLLERDFRHCWWQVCALWHQGCPSDSRDKMQYCSRKESIGISESSGCCHLHSRKRNLTRLHKVFHKKLLLDNLKVKQDQQWLLWDCASYYLSFSQSLLVQSWKWMFGNDWKFHKIQRFFFRAWGVIHKRKKLIEKIIEILIEKFLEICYTGKMKKLE